MARKFGPFDNSLFYEVENRRLQRAFNPQTGFAARPSTGQGLVTAGTGAQAIIAAYPDGALVDGMYVENPTSETVALTTNSGSTNPRTDRLVMRVDMSAKTIAPFQILGTPATTPQAPTLTQTASVFDMPLCRFTFPGSGSAQNPASFVDERVPLQLTYFEAVSRRLLTWSGTEFIKQSGPVELLYQNPDAGGSGPVNTGAGPTPVLGVNLPASGVTSDAGFVDVRAAVVPTATGGSVGTVSVVVNGQTRTKLFNAQSLTAPEIVPFAFPVTLPVGTYQLAVVMTVTAGVAAKLDHSSIAVNF